MRTSVFPPGYALVALNAFVDPLGIKDLARYLCSLVPNKEKRSLTC
jgi:hypothetical protein